MTYKNCPPVLESYLRYLKTVKNNAPKTIYVRYCDVKSFLIFFVQRESGTPLATKDIEQSIENVSAATIAAVTEDDISDYLEYLVEERHMTKLTIQRRKLPSLRQFYNYIFRYQEELGVSISKNPVQEHWEKAIPADPCRILSPAEISKVLDTIDKYAVLSSMENDTQNAGVVTNPAVRDKAIVLLLVTTGISVDELIRVRCQDYIEDTMIVAGRKVHLTEACRDALDTYLAEFRDPIEAAYTNLHDNALFITNNHRRRLSIRGVQNALKKHFDRAEVNATARDLRYTAIAEMLKSARNECELAYIAGRLGYSNVSSVKQLLLQMGLPIPSDTNAMPDLISGTWLDNIGRK